MSFFGKWTVEQIPIKAKDKLKFLSQHFYDQAASLKVSVFERFKTFSFSDFYFESSGKVKIFSPERF